ncbi:hypothetical protein [Nonomuraea sp. NPDC005650]|uniref:hypothetical protein n=1 Tax=Nonomuraea sp. NPDC005650 TaxID=3157045 RepID=UPI0033A38313
MIPPDAGPDDQLGDELAAARAWRARGERTDPAPRATSPEPCELHGAGHDPACTACRLVKREAITVALAAVNALVGGAVSARSQRAWMRAVETDPDLAGRRQDAFRNALAVAGIVMWSAKPSPVHPGVWTSIPTRARIMDRAGLKETAAKDWVRWLREHGYLGTVTEGSTPQYRGVFEGQDDGAGNLGAEYVLTIPLARQGSPEPLPAEPAEASAQPAGPAAQENSPPALVSGDEKRPPTVDLSKERSTQANSPVVRAREDRTAGSESADATDWMWPLSATPETKIEMLQAAQALRARSPILRTITAKHLRSLLREYFRGGWSPNDVLHGLDHRPDGTAWTFTEPPRWLPGWIRHRLAAWRTPTDDSIGELLPSLSQQRAALRQAAAAEQAAAAAARQRLLAGRVDAGAGPAAAARAALAAAGPQAAEALQRHQDQQPADLYNVKIMASHSGASTPPAGDRPLSRPQPSNREAIDAPCGSQRPAGRDSEITPSSITPPSAAIDDAMEDTDAGHAAFLAANDARNAANAGRRAELVEQARAIAAARTASAPANPRPATVVRAPLQNRLTDLMATHDDGSPSCLPGAPSPTPPVEQQARTTGAAPGIARTADAPVQPERTLQDRLADLMVKHAPRPVTARLSVKRS